MVNNDYLNISGEVKHTLTESSSKDTQENIHPGLPVDTIVFSPPYHDVVSEDVNEQMPNCNDGTVIVQERKEVEMTSDAKGKEIAEGSTSNEQENILQDQISEIVSGLPKVVSEHQMEITIQWGHAFNLAGIGNDRGIGSFSTLCQMLTGNSHTGGFEAASTSTGRGNNTVGLYQGGNNENQDPVRSGDGTIDLLSRVGLGSGAYEEGDGDHGDDNETESQLMFFQLFSVGKHNPLIFVKSCKSTPGRRNNDSLHLTGPELFYKACIC
ncbi:hypothetical protein Tco_0109902 [Tanacetum coccineum]